MLFTGAMRLWCSGTAGRRERDGELGAAEPGEAAELTDVGPQHGQIRGRQPLHAGDVVGLVRHGPSVADAGRLGQGSIGLPRRDERLDDQCRLAVRREVDVRIRGMCAGRAHGRAWSDGTYGPFRGCPYALCRSEAAEHAGDRFTEHRPSRRRSSR